MCEKEDEENDEERRKESGVKVAYIYRECIGIWKEIFPSR